MQHIADSYVVDDSYMQLSGNNTVMSGIITQIISLIDPTGFYVFINGAEWKTVKLYVKYVNVLV